MSKFSFYDRLVLGSAILTIVHRLPDTDSVFPLVVSSMLVWAFGPLILEALMLLREKK